MGPLPPDLSRLGDELTAAAARALERRRRRVVLARASAGVIAAIAAVAVLVSGVFGPRGPLQLAAGTEAEMGAVVARPPARPPVEPAGERVVDRNRTGPDVPVVIIDHAERS